MSSSSPLLVSPLIGAVILLVSSGVTLSLVVKRGPIVVDYEPLFMVVDRVCPVAACAGVLPNALAVVASRFPGMEKETESCLYGGICLEMSAWGLQLCIPGRSAGRDTFSVLTSLGTCLRSPIPYEK